ncbi:hypothetical protein [Vibrio owensii]|uniref:hypothetical protein n=1 Tax=Vibrio owensii TaxID=696485 RepID=UPI0018F1FBD1|nr:hypothetical protein [Vibrio owensii]
MFESTTAKRIDRKPDLSRFMLLINNEDHHSRITQFRIGHDNQPMDAESVSVEEVMQQLKEADSNEVTTPKRLNDPRVLFDNGRTLIWHYRPSKQQKLFLKHNGRNINQKFPFPSLVFAYDEEAHSLHIVAMRHHKRPDLDTRLYCAPLPNISTNGNVCLGNVVMPKTRCIDALSEEYLNSFKTHLNNTELFRKGETTNGRYFKWAKEAIKNNKISLAEIAVYGTLREFIKARTGQNLVG